MLLEDCDGALVDGFRLRGKTPELTSGVCYRLVTAGTYSALRITNVSAAGGVKEAGILLEATDKGATLTDYIISGNFASVVDRIQGRRAVKANNVPE